METTSKSWKSSGITCHIKHTIVGGYIDLVRHMVDVVGSCERHGIFEECMAYALFDYTL